MKMSLSKGPMGETHGNTIGLLIEGANELELGVKCTAKKQSLLEEVGGGKLMCN